MDKRKKIEDKFDKFWSEDAETDETVDAKKIYHRLQAEIQLSDDSFSKQSRSIQLKWGLSAAAVFILIFGLWWLFNKQKKGTNSLPDEVVVVKTGQEKRNIQLSDLSKVTLYPNSRIEYPQEFSKNDRKVRLISGKAFFEIQKDTKRVFQLSTSDLLITVLGTSFEVDYAPKSTNVKVQTGVVNVTQYANSQSIELIAQESLIYQKKQNIFRKVEKDKGLSNSTKSIEEARLTISFQHQTLKSVLKQLEKESGFQFELIAYLDNGVLFSKDYQNQTLQFILEDLSKIYQLTYQQVNNKIKLHSRYN